MEQQLALFALPESAAPACPTSGGKRFLTTNAAIFDSLLASTTLRDCAAEAAKQVSRRHGDARDTGTKFEDRLRDLVLQSDHAADISAETLADASARHPELGLVKAELTRGPKRDKTLADILLVARCDKARTVSVAVNIKRLKRDATSTEGGSTLQFLQLATETNFDPAAPPSPVGFDYHRAVLEMLSQRRRIKDGRDYWLLVARVDAGVLTGLEAWGTMVGTYNGGPLVARHVNRAVINVHQPDGTLPPDVDPNLTIADALLPAGGASAVRAHLVAMLRDTYGSERAAEAAGKLLDLDDRDLLDALVKALEL
jgi:hypothetical protein